MATSPIFRFMRIIFPLLLLALLPIIINPCYAEAGRSVKVGVYQAGLLANFDKEGSAHGLFVDILNHIAEKEQWTVQYLPGSWQEGLDRLKTDKIDLVLCIGYSEERDTYMDFPKEFLLLNWGVLYKAKGSSVTSLLDLEGKSVSALKGDIYLTSFKELAKQFNVNVKIQEVDQYSKVFQAIKSGTVAAGVAGNLYGLLNENAQSAEQTPVIFSPIKVGYAVNQGKNSDLITALDRNIAEMKADKASIYYSEIKLLLGKNGNKMPKEAYWVLSSIAGILLLTFVFIFLLRRQVRVKTVILEAEIVERKQVEKLLLNEKALLRSVIDSTTDLIYFKDCNGIYIGCNKAAEKFIGLSENEQIGKSDFDFFDYEIAVAARKFDQKVITDGVPVHVDEQVKSPITGSLILDTVKAPIIGLDGQPIGLVGISRDITERKEAEEALKKSEIRHRSIIETTMDGFWLVEEQGRLLEVNATYAQMSGYSVQELLTMGIVDLEVKESASDAVAHYNKIKFRGEDRFISKHRRKDGTIFDVEVSAKYLPLEGGVIVGFIRDITERIQSEKDLLDAKEFLELTQRSSGAGLWAWDFASGELSWSPEQYQIFGLDPAAGVPTFDLWRSVVHPDDLKSAESKIRDAISDRTQLFNEYRIIKHSGEIRWINAIGQLNYDESGEPRRMSGICLDVTNRKKVEEEKHQFEQQLQHTQKLESLGVLSGGIAHDFNNILAIIMGYCSLTKLDYESAEKNINEIEKAAERAAALCRQMLAYAGKAQLAKSQVNMHTMVDEMVTMLKSTLPQNAIIKPELSADIPYINADASQLRQVVMNLIINASEAVGTEQGEIKVSLTKKTVVADHPEIDYLGKEIPSGGYICLKVADNGCGMDEETKRRIFEPFYTTKFTGRGLGMSAVLGIINSHNGALQLFSQLGQGTTFKVYLPIQAINTTGDVNQIHASSVPWQGSGTVLLVEDEVAIRNIAKTFLEMFGFAVLEAVNGKEALGLYQRYATGITLVMTDMGMPIMDGYELLHELKKLNPDLPIIVSSGYGDAEVSSRLSIADIAGLISKPYNPDQLREVLKSALEGAH